MLLSSANKNRKRWLFRGIATLHFFHTRTARCRCPNPSGSEALRSAYILAQRVSLGLPVVDGIAISKQLLVHCDVRIYLNPAQDSDTHVHSVEFFCHSRA